MASSLLDGDVVTMGNCGFHHGLLTEGTLRLMLGMKGVKLLFQPPYSRHLNTCNYCFHEMNQRMKSDEHFSQVYTEIFIMDALNGISDTHSQNYFQYCGNLL